MKASEYPDFVLYLSADWEPIYRRGMAQALARRISGSGAKVLCLNRPVCLFTTPILHFKKWASWVGRRDHLRSLGDNLFLYTPYVLIHDLIAHRYVPGLLTANRRLLAKGMRGAMTRLGLGQRPLVAWVYHPFQLHYVGLAGETVTVYECFDEHAEGPGLAPGWKRLVQQLEPELLHRADLVFTTAAGLYAAKKGHNSNIHLFPNAADIEFFGRVQDPETPVAEAVGALPRPIVGYLGTIHEHTDIGLMKYVAEARPNWSIVMIGPEQPAIRRSEIFRNFRQLPNVKLLGWIEEKELSSYCKAFDICVIPYRTDSVFNRYVNPNKLHEYTAMGKPVVSTDIPEVAAYRDLIWIAKSREEFVACIEEALRAEGPEKVAARLRWAQENSWNARVEGMLEKIEGLLREKARGGAKGQEFL